jgi:signal transduction histidine kinase
MSNSEIHEVGALRDQRDALQHQIERFRILQHISQELVSELDLDLLLHNIMRSAIEVMEAQAGSLLLLDKATDELAFCVVEGGGGARLQGKRMSRRQGIGGWVLNHKQAVIVDDTLQDQRFYAEIGASVDYATTSMICAPMINRGEAIGVLQILNKRNGERFDRSDEELLIVLAAQSAVAIRNAQLYQELRDERDRIVVIEEDVRKRLARDLHDGPTQLVAAIIMNMQFIRRLMEREPERVDAELDEMMNLAEQAMRQLRTMLFDLRPVILEAKGLIPALEAYSSRLTETEQFTVYLEVEGEIPRLTRQAESAIFAVVQEAITNAKKHAEADHMWIQVHRRQDSLHISVRDDGGGFDVAELMANYASQGSLGMINMRERAEMIHSDLKLESTIGQGSTVHLTVPMPPNLPVAPGP